MTALLYSGGLDSYCVNKLYQPDTLVVVDPGTKEAAKERQLINRTVDDCKYVDMSFLAQFEQDDKVIPFRNSFFVLAAAQFDNNVFLGATRGDGITPDTTREWAAATETLLNFFGEPEERYTVSLPVRHMSKAELVAECDRQGVTYEQILEETKTCHYGSVEQGCGDCFDCLVRFVAFAGHEFVSLSTLSEYFDGDPWERVVDSPQRVVDDFARRGPIFESLLTVRGRLGYPELPEPSEVLSE